MYEYVYVYMSLNVINKKYDYKIEKSNKKYVEILEGGKGRKKWCRYIVISKIKTIRNIKFDDILDISVYLNSSKYRYLII